MATLNITNSFSNGDVANANQVNQNFIDVKTFAEAAVVQVDGSVKAGTVAIADSAVTAAKIAAGAVTTDKVTSGGTYPISISGNAVTAGSAGSATTAGSASTAGYASTAGNFAGLTTVPYSLIVNNSNDGNLEVLSLKRYVAPVGTPHMTAWRDSSDIIVAYVSYTGRVASTGTVVVLSDENEKHNIAVANTVELANAVDSLIPKTFVYNNDSSETVQLGFIAQDVQQVLPLAVTKFDDGRLGLATDTIVAALVAKCQDLESRLAALESK